MVKNPYRSVKTEVLEVITETPSIKTFRLRPSEPLSFLPGQFMEMSVAGIGEAPFTPPILRRPVQEDITIVRVGKVRKPSTV
jgi:NAD(P)H-flavin reductase